MNNKKQNSYFAMSQNEVADALDISRPMLNYIERRAYQKFKEALQQKGYKIEDVLVDAR